MMHAMVTAVVHAHATSSTGAHALTTAALVTKLLVLTVMHHGHSNGGARGVPPPVVVGHTPGIERKNYTFEFFKSAPY